MALFAFVAVLGFFAARWRRSDLTLLSEWGLGGGVSVVLSALFNATLIARSDETVASDYV